MIGICLAVGENSAKTLEFVVEKDGFYAGGRAGKTLLFVFFNRLRGKECGVRFFCC